MKKENLKNTWKIIWARMIQKLRKELTILFHQRRNLVRRRTAWMNPWGWPCNCPRNKKLLINKRGIVRLQAWVTCKIWWWIQQGSKKYSRCPRGKKSKDLPNSIKSKIRKRNLLHKDWKYLSKIHSWKKPS